MLNVKAMYLLGWIGLLAVLVFIIPISTEAAGTTVKGTHGGKTYQLYLPDKFSEDESYPLMVMLHGCTQDATQFAAGTKMNALADKERFIVLYPEQNSGANMNKCWNWFETAHQSRGSGEPAAIAGMVQKIESDYVISDNQVYVAGLSAGGGMSVIMGATYPDLFDGIGVGAGLEYKAAITMVEAFTAMSSGGPDPVNQGKLAYQAMGSRAQTLPVIAVHGTSDYTVNPINSDQIIKQWATTNNYVETGSSTGWIDDTPDHTENLQVPGGRAYTVYDYHNTEGKLWMQKVIVQGMGHAWSGGSTAGSYTDPQGPDASQMMWDFFQEVGDRPDIVTTTANPKGGTYQDSVVVELQADREATTYYTLDGTGPTTDSTVYTEPITIDKDTTLKFFSQDTSGIAENIKVEEYKITDIVPGDETVISSIASEDGFVGRYAVDGKGNGTVKAGDKGMYNIDTYRGILSFDTSNLTEPIHHAKIRLYKKASQGVVNSLQVDVKKGVFGSSSAIEQTDFASTPSASNIATSKNFGGEYIEILLPESSYIHINQSGKTQFRLQAATTAGFNANSIEFYGGEEESKAPQLIINSQN
ncbi:extracellular catalytic domain type 1 short-chain-length polyhydroxyalkanoate depolymerase [Oceanobacillus piezotolerans]|uniref:extracellular catalytic domain type 1 short-chain-length polyhydroxyalkanoate depolymerase n=1 Tax=Oceanobacillus piezotolerans TaxID=2448030 RepID=UPI001FE59977|nr:PHB depolymerase family esterase [Oceanobacillus piezotolerans]